MGGESNESVEVGEVSDGGEGFGSEGDARAGQDGGRGMGGGCKG